MAALCKLMGEESYTSFTMCLIQNFNSSETKELVCKSSNVINNESSSCRTTFRNQLNEHFIRFTNFPIIVNINTKVFLTFCWNRFDPPLKSNYFEFNENTAILTTLKAQILIDVNNTMNIAFTYQSRCTKNYYGPNCENFCESVDDITGHRNCTTDGKPFCLPGWRGTFCSEAICNGCVNGQCLAPGMCKCDHGWFGKSCNSCEKAPECRNGICNSTTGIPFTCICQPGWGGQNCDIDLKYCLTHQDICQNNGTCHNYYGDSRIHYMCLCAPGYSGRHCQIKTGDCIYSNCISKPCLKELPIPKCRCYSGFSGSYCQINNSIQIQFQSIKKDIESGGFCFSSDKGYTCSCSKLKRICQCRFIKCPINSSCTNKFKSDQFCSDVTENDSKSQFTHNFGFNESSLTAQVHKADHNFNKDKQFLSSVVTPRSELEHKFNDESYFKLYVGSFVVIPIILGIIVLVIIKFSFKFHKKSKACVLTIHNDLGLPNNTVNRPVKFPEQRFLLHQIPMTTSLKNDKCLNNIFVVQDPAPSDLKYKDLTWKADDVKDIEKSSSKKNPIVCNPNLLINHYKDLYENGK